LPPILVHEEQGLRAAFLSAAGIGILVALPGHVVHIADIRPQNLPVEACILEEDLHIRFKDSESRLVHHTYSSLAMPLSNVLLSS